MFSYESGVALAFLLWLYRAIAGVVRINSTMERNLNRVGQRLSWATGNPKPLEVGDLNRSVSAKIGRYLLLVALGAPWVLLSWLYLIVELGLFLYRLRKDAGAPAEVREYRWKLRNLELTFDQHLREIMKVTGEDPATFDAFRARAVAEMKERGLPDPRWTDEERYGRKAAEQGDADAQSALGDSYYLGQGAPEDYEQAAVWYRKAAEQGHVHAQSALGSAYHLGEGVPEDYEQAAAWYRKAAEQGHVQSQFALGGLYHYGHGVPEDREQAAAWYRKAAEQGHGQAQERLKALG